MRPAAIMEVLVFAAVTLFNAEAAATATSDGDRTLAQSLYSEGMSLLDGDSLDAAAANFRAVIEIDSRHAPSHVGLGHVYLKAGDLKAAERAFMDARRRQHKYAPAYNGLGLVWREKPKGLYTAIDYFKQALRYDRNYLEARYHIAEARYALGEHDVRREAEKLLKMDASFAPAHRLLGEWYETFKEDHLRAAEYYERYLALRPDDLDVTLRLAGALGNVGDHARVVDLMRTQMRSDPDAIQISPVLANAYMELDSLDLAEVAYKSFLDACEPAERLLYEDIRLLASPDEYEAFANAPDRDAYLTRFWGDRDPDLTTAANERQLEHYRRVWFARRHFSNSRQPWDTRGEVYVRFGDPDHRSRSDWMNFQQKVDVQKVKEGLAIQLHGAAAVSRWGTILVAFPVRSVPEDYGGFKAPTHSPVLANGMDASMVPWESWVYVNNGVGGGMEVTFTDEMLNGAFDYAPPPIDVDIDIQKLAAYNRLSPRNVCMRSAARYPNYFQPPVNEDPLEFYYDLADFRGQAEAASALEVYAGIPHHAAQYLESEDATTLDVERTVALLNKETGEVYREKGDVHFRRQGDVSQTQGAFVPDVVRLDVPPGHYRMEVKARDKRTGRRGRYRQIIHVEAYPESGLRISDLELAWRITEDNADGKFSKGELHVVPMPTRTYGRGYSVYVYYEIYNLARDTFGRTRYRVSYTVGRKGESEFGNIVRLVRLRGNRQVEVEVASEQVGTDSTEVEYVALQLGQQSEGRQVLQVAVTDLNSGETVTKNAGFVVK
ncbi:MAG: GWxTD domain-containing protein [Gemmatimonadota bacterium]|nr:GWxTD domain-containing protein [Gemmatimonadota bacterium]